MHEGYLYAITALLPLSALMVVVQTNPYHALVIRGILGAIAALVYATLGAADVALTEALVGTMLAIALYAVAVRSSLVLRLGAIASPERYANADEEPTSREAAFTKPLACPIDPSQFGPFLSELRAILRNYHMRVEVLTYPDLPALQQALHAKEVHATCLPVVQEGVESGNTQPAYHLNLRVPRLYQIMQTDLAPTVAHLSYVDVANAEQKLP